MVRARAAQGSGEANGGGGATNAMADGGARLRRSSAAATASSGVRRGKREEGEDARGLLVAGEGARERGEAGARHCGARARHGRRPRSGRQRAAGRARAAGAGRRRRRTARHVALPGFSKFLIFPAAASLRILFGIKPTSIL